MGSKKMHIGIVGSGASSVYLLNKMLKDTQENGKVTGLEISIFEKGAELGIGMPYDPKQVSRVHIVNILPEETPELVVSFEEWLKARDDDELREFGIPDRKLINDKGVYSRIAMGRYLKCQYDETIRLLREGGVAVNEHPKTAVVDAIDNPESDKVTIKCADGTNHTVDKMIISTGHVWPTLEQPNARNFKSPWPIDKVLPGEGEKFNFKIGVLGASLSAFDVITCLAEKHGHFERQDKEGKLIYVPDAGTEKFEIAMHSGKGRLPHIRCKFKWPDLVKYRFFSRQDVDEMAVRNGEFSIESFFQNLCKPHLVAGLRSGGLGECADKLEHPSMTFKGFIDMMNALRRYEDPFKGLRDELTEAKKSVEDDTPLVWKETMDELIYTLNAHAAELPAEDLRFYKEYVIPFASNLSAFLPHESAEKLIALHEAGKVSLVKGKVFVPDNDPTCDYVGIVRVDPKVGEKVEYYERFIDCTGQKTVSISQFPMQSLVRQGVVREPSPRFRSNDAGQVHQERIPQEVRISVDGKYHYLPGGIEIDQSFCVVGQNGEPSTRIYDVAYPHIRGQRPYFTGLSECKDAGNTIAKKLLGELREQTQGWRRDDITRRGTQRASGEWAK